MNEQQNSGISSQTTVDLIENYIIKVGWTYEKIDTNKWLSIIQIEDYKFPIFIKRTKHWVFISVIPLIATPRNKASKRRIYKKILEMNRQLKMAKLNVDDDGDIYMSVEFPSKDLSFSEFKDCCDALTTYLTHYWINELKNSQTLFLS